MQVYPWYSNKIRRCGKSVDLPYWRNSRGYKRYSTAEFKIYMCTCGNTWRSFEPDFLEDRKGRKKCRSNHKKKYGYMLSRDLFHYHHKREFSKKIHEELLAIAWHPDRVYDWCFDEEEKGFLEEMWKSFVWQKCVATTNDATNPIKGETGIPHTQLDTPIIAVTSDIFD